MSDLKVNLQTNVDKLSSIVKGDQADKEGLADEITSIFEEENKDKDGNILFGQVGLKLRENSVDMSAEDVSEFFGILQEFAALDGDEATLSKNEINLISQLLEGEDVDDMLSQIEEDKIKNEEKSIEPIEEEPIEEENEEPSESGLSDADVIKYVYRLDDAMNCVGTDEDAVFDILNDPSLTPEDILKIKEVYQQEIGKSLENDIKQDFSGKTEDSLLAIFENAEKAVNDGKSSTGITDDEAVKYAYRLDKAMNCVGTDEDAVFDILNDPSLTPEDILKIKEVYQQEIGKSLENDIKQDFSGKTEDSLLKVFEKAEEAVNAEDTEEE